MYSSLPSHKDNSGLTMQSASQLCIVVTGAFTPHTAETIFIHWYKTSEGTYIEQSCNPSSQLGNQENVIPYPFQEKYKYYVPTYDITQCRTVDYITDFAQLEFLFNCEIIHNDKTYV
jgi:hypothetical protein